MKRWALAGTIAGGAALLAASMAGMAIAAGSAAPQPTPTGLSASSAPGWGMMGGYGGWMPGMNVGDEADYLTEMVAHHQDAVRAAQQLRRSGRAEMRALGESIVTVQSAEITTMTAWLDRWYAGRSADTGYRPMMRDLSTLSGDALDQAFLRDMIPHHMVAVMMSQRLLASGRARHPEVADFAATVRDTQSAEIVQMRRYLADWFAGGGAPSGMWGQCPGY